MKNIFFIFAMSLLFLIPGCGVDAEKGKVPYSSEEVCELKYENVVSSLKAIGFENIEVSPMAVLDEKTEADMENTVFQMSVDGEKSFKKDQKFALTSEIRIAYYSYSEGVIPVAPDEVKGTQYEDTMNLFENAGFINVQNQLIKDNEKDNIYNNEVEYITVNGNMAFSVEETYPINTEIIVYHSFFEQNLPILSNEAKGKSLDEVKEILSSTKFDIQYELIEDVDNDNIYEDEVEYIKVNSTSDFTLGDLYPVNTKVVVYHSYLADKMPITSSDAKGKTCDEVLKLFENLKFEDVTVKSATASENIENSETTVDKIVVNNNSEYTTDQAFPFNSEIVIHYSIRKYNVAIELNGLKSGFFSPEYDVSVYVDNEYLGTLRYNEKDIFNVLLEKGTYDLILISDDDESVIGKEKLQINTDQNFRYDISCKSSEVGIEYYKTLNVPYTNDTAIGKDIVEVEKAFKDAGYEWITTIEVNDLDPNSIAKSNTVSKLEINSNSNFTKDTQFYSDSKVTIYYHQGKLVEVPMSFLEVNDYNYEIVVNAFKEAGFINVSAEKYTGKYKDSAENNMVHSVEINGDDWFSSGSDEPLDAKVVVYYYSINYGDTTVSIMMNELEKNAYNAKQHYTDRYVSVTGWVSSIDSSGKNFELVSSTSSWDFLGVTCKITESEQKELIAKLSAGNKITVKGRITYVGDLGYTMDIHNIVY